MTGRKSKNGYTEHVDEEEQATEGTAVPDSKSRSCFCSDGFKVIVAGSVLFGIAVTIGLIVDTYTKPKFLHGGAATEAPECTQIALDILKSGKGNAVDAAVASMFCLAVVRPESLSLAGAGYSVLFSNPGVEEAIDFQFAAPSGASQNIFGGNKSLSQQGGLAVAVPGLVKGLDWIHTKHGRLTWSEVMQKAISLAENGFVLSNSTARAVEDNFADLPQNMKDIYAVDGKPKKAGSIIKLPDLASTLKIIAKDKSKGLYKSQIAEDLLREVRSVGGILAEADLADYAALSQKLLKGKFADEDVLVSGPPSSGALVLSALNIISNLPFGNGSRSLDYHYVAETLKLVFAQSTKLGDPAFESVDQVLEKILSVDEAKRLAGLVSGNKTFPASHYEPAYAQPLPKFTAETPTASSSVSVTAIGSDGFMVSITGSLGGSFGAKFMTKSGIVLNNGMDCFSSPGFSNHDGVFPSSANFIKPGKRPFSGAAPLLVLNQKVPRRQRFSLASSSDTQGLSSIIHVLANLFQFKMADRSAMTQPRVHDQLLPDILYVEGDRLQNLGLVSVVGDLQSLGHQTQERVGIGSVNMVAKVANKVSALADERRDGAAMEF